MKQSKCRLCGAEHPLGAPHAWSEKAQKEGLEPFVADLPRLEADIVGDALKIKDPFDRLKYQREYMRDWPKAKAEGLTVKQWREKKKEDER